MAIPLALLMGPWGPRWAKPACAFPGCSGSADCTRMYRGFPTPVCSVCAGKIDRAPRLTVMKRRR
jgi:hypothetical protein